MELKFAVAVFTIATMFCYCQGVDKYTLRTHGSSTKYLKASPNGPVTCGSGKSGALHLHILDPALTATGGETSFRSSDDNRYYIKSDDKGDTALKYYSQPDWEFEKYGSFKTRKNYFKSGTTSYESLLFSGYYLTCRGGELVLDRPSTDREKSAASFIQDEVESDPDDGKWHPCSKSCGGGRQTSKERTCIGIWCAQPTTRRCNVHKCVEPCKPDPCAYGDCVDQGSTFYCDCYKGYTGKLCDKEVDPCEPNPCKNNGDCSRKGSGYICICDAGFTGKNCEIDDNPCKPNPCQNSGQCSRRGGTEYRCNCPNHFTGRHCEIPLNPCKPNPCRNNGDCYRTGSGYECICDAGFTGKNCEEEENPCKSKPCQNGGKCNRLGGTEYRCKCTSGFTGHHCQTSTGGGGGGGKCTSTSCKNGGTCVETAKGYACNCRMGWHGSTCTKRLGMKQWSDCSRTCGGGTRYRATACSGDSVDKCPREYADCNLQPCPKASCKSNEQPRYYDNSRCCNKATSQCGSFSRTVGARVFGGTLSGRAEWPWMAGILYTVPDEPLFFCGGAIIHKDWVLSAAHCADLFPADELEILVGANTRGKPEHGHRKMKVSKIVVHPDFDNPKHDVGLFKLKSSLSFNTAFIKPICLPNGEATPVELECFVAGWGVARKENLPDRITEDRLRHVGIRRQPLDACVQGYKDTQFEDYIGKEVLCAGLFSGGKDSCSGDSGGALVCQRKHSCDWYVAGITSFGPDECGSGTIPGGYVDVIYYEKWIKQQISNG